MNDDPNPYAPPLVRQTRREVLSKAVFHHRVSTRSWRAFLILPLPLYMFATILFQVRMRGTNYISWELVLPTIAATGLLTYLVSGLMVPRVYEFRVDDESVQWRCPWPRRRCENLPIADLRHVEYAGGRVTLTLNDGLMYRPPPWLYGHKAREVARAIAAAAQQQDAALQVVVRDKGLLAWLGTGR